MNWAPGAAAIGLLCLLFGGDLLTIMRPPRSEVRPACSSGEGTLHMMCCFRSSRSHPPGSLSFDGRLTECCRKIAAAVPALRSLVWVKEFTSRTVLHDRTEALSTLCGKLVHVVFPVWRCRVPLILCPLSRYERCQAKSCVSRQCSVRTIPSTGTVTVVVPASTFISTRATLISKAVRCKFTNLLLRQGGDAVW